MVTVMPPALASCIGPYQYRPFHDIMPWQASQMAFAIRHTTGIVCIVADKAQHGERHIVEQTLHAHLGARRD